MERRYSSAAAAILKFRKAEADGQESPGTLSGYGAVFYNPSDPGTEFSFGGWADMVERIMPGAFDRAIKEDDCRGLFNHDPNQILGRSKAATMTLAVDRRGLLYTITLPNSPAGLTVAEAARRGDLTGSSFAFVADEVVWREEKDANGDMLTIREIHSVQLFDVGPVVYPAYESTTTGLARAEDLEPVRQDYGRWKGGGADPGLHGRLASIKGRAAAVAAVEDKALAVKLASYKRRARIAEIGA
jgi:HK97 family phage prohead protease